MYRRGFSSHAVSSPAHRLVDFGATHQVETHGIEMRRSISPLQDLVAVRRLTGLFRIIRPTIVHAHTPKGGLLGMIASCITRTPIRVYHIRGLPYMTASGKRRTLLKMTERVSCLLAGRVFCVSHSIREVAIADGIVSSDKIVVFGGGSGNGVDSTERYNPARFTGEEGVRKREELGIPVVAPVVLFVGRVVRDKGVEELARAWADIRELFPNARLVLAGPPESRDTVSEQTRIQLIQDERVVLTGAIDDPAIYYALADLVVLPTYREGFPNVPLEAAAMELPVVATRIPGCIDAVQDGVTGTLVPPREVEPLVAAICRYLDDPELRVRHGKAGRERVLREFRQEAIWEAIYQEYCRLLTQRGIPIPTPDPAAAQ
ncbi:MAG: glycosyltransferase family 4 protein [Thermomicrobiales bacterium]